MPQMSLITLIILQQNEFQLSCIKINTALRLNPVKKKILGVSLSIFII